MNDDCAGMIFRPIKIQEEPTEVVKNNVDHPSHYQGNKYECIEVMRDVFGDEAVKTWIELNIFKYAWRADKKNGKEDIEKIAWYSNYYSKMN